MRVFRAGILKLSRRLATWLTFGILLAILGLIFVAVGATPADTGGDPGEEGFDPALLLAFPAAYDNGHGPSSLESWPIVPRKAPVRVIGKPGGP